MQTLHFPFFFTKTGLASQSRKSVSQMKLALRRRSTSSLRARRYSAFLLLLLLHSFRLREDGQFVTGISVENHANTSRFSNRSFLSCLSSWAESFTSIQRTRYGWSRSTWNRSTSSPDLWLASSDSEEESESGLSPHCDCYSTSISFNFFSSGRISSRVALAIFDLQPDFFWATAEMVVAAA